MAPVGSALRERLGLAPSARGADERALMARAGFYLFALGGLLAFLSLALPAAGGRDEAALAGAALAACLLGVLELVGYDRLPLPAFHALTAAGTVLVSWAVYFGGAGGSLYALFYFWVVLYAAYFFGARATAAQVAFVALAYGIVLALSSTHDQPALAWLLTVGTLSVVAGLVGVLRTRLERLLAGERERVEKLRELDRLRDELVVTASHQLRTPVSAVFGAAETLRRRPELPDERREELLGVINQEAARLARLVSDFLVAGGIDARRLDAELAPVDVGALVREVVAASGASPAAPAISIRVPEALPPASADRAKLAQVLASLLDNACKYSPAHGVVEVAATADGGRVLVDVCDEGVGVPAGEQERIFEKFHRLDPNLVNGVGGAGLGLYIARELVRTMGGEIRVRSAVGRGSTFTVDLAAAGAGDTDPS